MIKFFEHKKGFDLENKVNEWISTNVQLSILDIKYQAITEDNEVWHYAIVFYTNKKD